MRWGTIRCFSGPNIWSPRPRLEAELVPDADGFAIGFAVEQACERLERSLQSARAPCDIGRTGLFEPTGRPAHAAHLVAAMAARLQAQVGRPADSVNVETAGPRNPARIVLGFSEEAVVRLVIEMALELVAAALGGAELDVSDSVGRLRERAEETSFGGTTGPIVDAARRRGIPVTRLDGDCLVQLGHGARQRRLLGSLTGRTGKLADAISSDKHLTRELLKQIGIPVPPGRLVRDADDAWTAACELGGPVVVKPRDEDCGLGVSLMLKTRAAVVEAYRRARELRPDVLVERHVPGVPHRLFVVNNRLVGAVRREPAQVHGNGRQTVAELVVVANRDPRRGDGRDDPLYPIVIDVEALETLRDQRLDLNSVPAAGRIVFLRYDPKTCYGGTIIDVTAQVHPEVASLALDAVAIVGLDVAGLDLMAVDIGRPLQGQYGTVLEINSGPAIYLHREPFCHPRQPVVEAILDSLFPPDDMGRIPIVAVSGGKQRAALAASIADSWREFASDVGLATAVGVSIDGRPMPVAPPDAESGCRALLLHPRVARSVCEIAPRVIRVRGLPFAGCQVAVLIGTGASVGDGDLEKCLRVLVNCVIDGGAVIADADDAQIAALFGGGESKLVCVAALERNPLLARHRQLGGRIVFMRGREVIVAQGEIEASYRPALVGRRRSGTARAEPLAVDDSHLDLLAIAAHWALTDGATERLPGICRPPRCSA